MSAPTPHDANGTIASPRATLLAEIARRATCATPAARSLAFEGYPREARRIENADALVDGIVHDFRSYMQIAMGSLEAIREHLRNGRADKAAGRIEAALRALDRAGALSRHLAMTSGGVTAGARPHGAQPLHVNDVIAGTEGVLQSALGERIELDLTLGEDLPSIRCDRLRLESAILNLAINARDAMPEGGTLRIETARVQSYVSIAVTDTGCGMTSGVLARAFEKFYTTKPAGRGSGLGLAMVRTLIERLHGHIEIDSVVGRGTRVTLLLPSQSDDGAPPEHRCVRQPARS
jgi:signal transduction histidine kinase